MIRVLRALLDRPLGPAPGRAVVVMAASVMVGFVITLAAAIVSPPRPARDADRPPGAAGPRPGARRALVGPLAGVLAGPLASPFRADAAIALPGRGCAGWVFLKSPPRPRTSP